MQRLNRDEQLEQWIKMEHYRLHCVERWSNSGYNKAVIAAIRSTLNKLEAASSTPAERSRSLVGSSRQALLLELPSRSQSPAAISRSAA